MSREQKLNYFIDCEFLDNGIYIDLLSIGLACEDGREFYAINSDCNIHKSSDWVVENVLPNLEHPEAYSPSSNKFSFGSIRKWEIEEELAIFLGCETVDYIECPNTLGVGKLQVETRLRQGKPKPVFWGEYCSHDWVAFTQLFGPLIDIPKGFPFRINDIMLYADIIGVSEKDLPSEYANIHNALLDARDILGKWRYLNLHVPNESGIVYDRLREIAT